MCPQSPLLLVFLATAFNLLVHNGHAEFTVHSRLVFNLMLIVKCQAAPWHPGLSSFLQHPLAPAFQSCWSGESKIASKTSCLFRVIFSLLAHCYIKGSTDQDFKMKLVFPFPLWLWCFRNAWTTPAIQRRLKIQQENSMSVAGLGEGRDSQRKGVGAKALLAKAEGVLKLLWGCIRRRNGRKLCIPIFPFSLSSFSR